VCGAGGFDAGTAAAEGEMDERLIRRPLLEITTVCPGKGAYFQR
jgi:hypothetical protein